jgi:hypothetical protein
VAKQLVAIAKVVGQSLAQIQRNVLLAMDLVKQ